MGPATDRTPGLIEKLLQAGLDVARLNASHGDAALLRQRVRQVRAACERADLAAAILIDLPGPKLRLGVLKSSLELKRGQELYLGKTWTDDTLPMADPSVLKDLKKGDPVFLADGNVRLVVLRAGVQRVYCRVERAGLIRSRSGVNLPQSRLSVKLPTPQDRWAIRVACEEGVEWLAISFVRTAEDVRRIRKVVQASGKKIHLMAKIEKQEALENLSEIAQVADGLMVARGDLGVETPLEEVPLVQKRVIQEARRWGKPVVTATQMLESMIENSSPTRAEVTDVANAVLDGTDAVMLSAETAIGAYPEGAVRVLDHVLGATEKQYPYTESFKWMAKFPWTDRVDAVGLATCRLAMDINASAILVGGGAVSAIGRLSRFRPSTPILIPSTASVWTAAWNTHLLPGCSHREAAGLISYAKRRGWIRSSELVILFDRTPRGEQIQVIQI